MKKPTFEQWLRGNGRQVKSCNCGGPQYGTEHSPDCAWELSALDLQDEYENEMYERFDYDIDAGEPDIEMAQGGAAYNDVMGYNDGPDW